VNKNEWEIAHELIDKAAMLKFSDVTTLSIRIPLRLVHMEQRTDASRFSRLLHYPS